MKCPYCKGNIDEYRDALWPAGLILLGFAVVIVLLILFGKEIMTWVDAL